MRNPTRASLFALVRERPGSLQGELAQHLGVARATVRHHLVALQRAGMLQVVSGEQRAAVFPSAMPPGAPEALAVLQRGRTRELADMVAANPGIAQGEITQRLGISRKLLRKYMDRLVAYNLVEETAGVPVLAYYPTDLLGRFLLEPGESAVGGLQQSSATPPPVAGAESELWDSRELPGLRR